MIYIFNYSQTLIIQISRIKINIHKIWKFLSYRILQNERDLINNNLAKVLKFFQL